MSIIMIEQNVMLESIRVARPTMIWYGANTCWWTHSAEDLREAGRLGGQPLPSDPRGGMLFQTDDPESFLRNAEEHSEHWGEHGINAFLAAHHRNCTLLEVNAEGVPLIGSGRRWCMPTWQEYNEAINACAARARGETA